jgi:hypothetical protein
MIINKFSTKPKKIEGKSNSKRRIILIKLFENFGEKMKN